MFNYSLKTKVTLLFPLAITILFAFLLLMVHAYLQQYIKESVSNHQNQFISVLAEDIDSSLARNSVTIVAIAENITPEMVNDPPKALSYLKQHSDQQPVFNNGLFIFNHAGRIVAEFPAGLERSGLDFSFREYFKQTIATGKPVISDPYLSSQEHRHPSIMLTAPIFDRHGALLGVMGGAIDLVNTGFLGRLANVKIGKNGYTYLFSTDRLMVLHPDKTRIMKRDIPAGANKLLDKAVAGFDGSGETVNSRGLHALTTFKHLKNKNWIFGANYPVIEAYAPANKIRNVFLIILPAFSLVLFLFMRRYLDKITSPIIELTRHVEGLPTKKGVERTFQTETSGDVATLGEAFNELVRESDLQRSKLESDLDRYELADARLQRQNEYLQALHETTLGLISRLDVASLMQALVTRAGSLVGTEHCYAYLKNAAGTEMEMVYQSGIYNKIHHYPIKRGQGIAGQIWSTGELFYINDYSRWEGRLPDPDRDVLKGMAGVPLKSGDEVVGVLGVAFVDEGIFLDDEQMQLLVQFGELASLALENARLNDQSHRELAERIKAEEHLRKLSVAVEQSPASILITDTFGTIEYVNPHFTKLTGYTFDEAVGRNPRMLKTGGISNEEYKRLWETILAGGEWRGEFHNRKKNGELYWEQALIAPIRDNNNEITHFIAIKEDVTERNMLEGQLRQAQKMDAIGQLAGGIAHDFNNILTAIVGYASIMQLRLPEGSPIKKHAEQIIATAERGASLTQGLLAFSRKSSSNPMVVDLNEVISRVQQLLLRLISKDINLEINLEQTGLPVLADSSQIEQVLMNLLTNARDAMPQGGSIVIRTEAVTLDSDFIIARGFGVPGRYALLTFNDSGEGMEAETVKHVFEPFYTTKEIGKGTGLGLPIIYGIIKKMGGYIICYSTIGIGTVFQIYLPLLDSAPTGSEKEVKGNGLEVCGTDMILLAEDDEATRKLGREILEEFGYSVIEAVDGEDALEKFRVESEHINMVILDVFMPKINGRNLFDAIRKIDANMRILFYSGYAKDVVISQGELDEGMNYLPKPFTPKELLMKIREVLGNEP